MLKFEQLDVDADDVLGVEYFDGCEKNLSIALPSAKNWHDCISVANMGGPVSGTDLTGKL
jgi:hypothetical protein